VDTGMVLGNPSIVVVIDQHSVAEELRTLATTLLGVLRTLLVWALVPLVRRSLVPLWEA
jgi:hypothetical protein